MKPHREKSSTTALYFAGFRAAESRRADGERLVKDPIAEHFLPILFRVLSPGLAARAFDKLFAGIATYGICRSRAAEEAVLATGARQVVVLGAGYETLSWRAARADLRFYEVDHPATLDDKRRRLARAGIEIPANQRFVSADLGERGWIDRLRDAGFRRTEKTLYLALGLFMYLDAASVDVIVHRIATSAPGSRLLFDIVPPDVVERRSRHRGARLGTLLAGLRGESFRFGLAAHELPSFFSVRGLQLVELLDGSALAARFRRGPMPEYVMLGTAEVPTPTGRP